MRRLRPIMLGGTGSDVGKSVISAGLCRIFLQDGYRPAPFKAQNMALNSAATPDGKEIGRAQAAQAEACGLEPSTDMNPILLKPTGGNRSQVIVNGKAIGSKNAYEFYKSEGREHFRKIVTDAFRRLSRRYNPIVMEGAGSIAELNLMDTDIVNMWMAGEAGAAVVLVADIDRGGVFASVYGSIMLQSEENRRRIKGIIVNKFRGDLKLFNSGRKMLEEICGVPVLGVIPYFDDIRIDEEDSVALAKKASCPAEGAANIAVVLTDHISNYTDFSPLERIEGVNLFYTKKASDVWAADIVILPGSKSTISDLSALKRNGMARAIIEAAAGGKRIWGICGGYQMLGQTITDPELSEGSEKETEGLGLLPIVTELSNEKRTVGVKFRPKKAPDSLCSGYEIHSGVSSTAGGGEPFCIRDDGSADGWVSPGGNIVGTYMHGLFENRAVREMLLDGFVPREKLGEDFEVSRERDYDRLADHLRQHLDMDLLYSILASDD